MTLWQPVDVRWQANETGFGYARPHTAQPGAMHSPSATFRALKPNLPWRTTE
jgi:hypothetical protein